MAKTGPVQIFLIAWFIISIWPVINYYLPCASCEPFELDSSPSSALHIRDKLIVERNIDQFSNYHKSTECSFSSLDLHKPTYPLCAERDTRAILDAMSGGGRIGNDAPYQPRGCDMRWFSTEEICDILSRFERISIVGDSLMRDIAIAFHVFLRMDLVHGAQQHWIDTTEGQDCSCEEPWDNKACNWYITINSDQIYREHSELMACPMETTAYVKYHAVTAYPIQDDMIQGYIESAFPIKPFKPHAVVMGAGLWNDIDQEATKRWVDQVVNVTMDVSPWLFEDNQMNPRLFLTPNAAHAAKDPKHWAKQGNIPLSMFEVELGSYVKNVHGIDHLGTYNMSIQASSHDGTHAGMRVNLLKVMAILNWLNSLDVSRW